MAIMPNEIEQMSKKEIHQLYNILVEQKCEIMKTMLIMLGHQGELNDVVMKVKGGK